MMQRTYVIRSNKVEIGSIHFRSSSRNPQPSGSFRPAWKGLNKYRVPGLSRGDLCCPGNPGNLPWIV